MTTITLVPEINNVFAWLRCELCEQADDPARKATLGVATPGERAEFVCDDCADAALAGTDVLRARLRRIAEATLDDAHDVAVRLRARAAATIEIPTTREFAQHTQAVRDRMAPREIAELDVVDD